MIAIRDETSGSGPRPWRAITPPALAGAAAGAATALAYAAVSGMPAAEVGHLAWLFGISALITALTVAVAARLLAGASLRWRLTGVAVAGALVGLANLAVLAALMLVDPDDALLVAVLLIYSLGAGIGTALALARPSAQAVERAVEEQRRDLITAVSHDLRTPLASLTAMIAAIDDAVVEDPETVRRYAGEMRTSVGALNALVDDLFELIRLDAAALEREAAATVGDVVGAAIAACGGSASEKGLRIEASLDGADEAVCSPRLERVVQNLIQNAIRHTPGDGTVRVEARRGPGEVRVLVSDDGEGIRPESLDRIFEPFWRGDTARSSAGSGLGLTLAKRIVEAQGGQIRVDSAPDHGSRFAIVVPEVR